MFWGPSIIQFGALFTLFLIWVFNKNPVALFHAKAAFDKRNADLAETQRGRARPDTLPHGSTSPSDVEGRASSHKYQSVGDNFASSDRVLFEGLVMLALGVILNYIGQGNRTAGDVFSLLILFSVFLVACFHWSGYGFVAHGLWLVAHISILGLFLTPWCTRYTNPI